MKSASRLIPMLASSALLFASTSAVLAHDKAPDATRVDPCQSYEQDVREDLRLLAVAPSPIDASRSPANAARLALAQAGDLRLAPQASAVLAVTPERPMMDEGSYAGVVTLQIEAPGRYRVSVGTHFWVDLIDADGAVLDSVLFAGRSECKPLAKLVEYDVRKPGTYTLQLTGGPTPSARVVVRQVGPATQ